MTTKTLKDVIKRVDAWPEEDQAELVEFARALETRRTKIYVLSSDERAAIKKARKSKLVSESEMDAFWKRFGAL